MKEEDGGEEKGQRVLKYTLSRRNRQYRAGPAQHFPRRRYLPGGRNISELCINFEMPLKSPTMGKPVSTHLH
eukprot:1866016-Pleurochrysis_carterae.AAC.1